MSGTVIRPVRCSSASIVSVPSHDRCPAPQPTRPSDLVRIEARALLELAIRLDGPMAAPFAAAIDRILAALASGNKLILLGIGKSGLIARKIAATLRSTGSPRTTCIPPRRCTATSA